MMKESKLRLRVVTPAGVVFDGGVESASFPGTLGPFAVLSGHAPIVSSLESGQILYVSSGASETKKTIDIGGGFVEVSGDRITVIAEAAAK